MTPLPETNPQPETPPGQYPTGSPEEQIPALHRARAAARAAAAAGPPIDELGPKGAKGVPGAPLGFTVRYERPLARVLGSSVPTRQDATDEEIRPASEVGSLIYWILKQTYLTAQELDHLRTAFAPVLGPVLEPPVSETASAAESAATPARSDRVKQLYTIIENLKNQHAEIRQLIDRIDL